MGVFGSYLELFVAFNLAYVLTGGFFKRIILNGLGVVKRFRSDVQNNRIKINEKAKAITKKTDEQIVAYTKEGKKKKLIDEEKAKLKKALKILNKEKKSLDSISSQFEFTILNIKTPEGFPQICLLSGLFCLASLLHEGFYESFSFVTEYATLKSHHWLSHIVLWSYILLMILFFGFKLNLRRYANLIVGSVSLFVIIVTLAIGCFYSLPVEGAKTSYTVSNNAAYTVKQLNEKNETIQIKSKIYKDKLVYSSASYITILTIPYLHFIIFILLAGRVCSKELTEFEADLSTWENEHDAKINESDLPLLKYTQSPKKLSARGKKS